MIEERCDYNVFLLVRLVLTALFLIVALSDLYLPLTPPTFFIVSIRLTQHALAQRFNDQFGLSFHLHVLMMCSLLRKLVLIGLCQGKPACILWPEQAFFQLGLQLGSVIQICNLSK